METMYYGHASVSSQQAYSEPVKSTPIHSMSSALNRVPDLRGRLAALSEKLCGPLPPQGASAGKELNAHGGLLGAIEQEARSLERQIDEMHGLLSRIEEALP